MNHTSNKIFLLSGPPGAGKSTLAKSIAQLFAKSIHIECDALYNMVQGGYKNPWEDKADVLLALMYQVFALQATTYLNAGFVVVSDYVWTPDELYHLVCDIKVETLCHPVFLLPNKNINVARDVDREYPVGSDRVAAYWGKFAQLKEQLPSVFYDNSMVLADDMAQTVIKESGFNRQQLKKLFNL